MGSPRLYLFILGMLASSSAANLVPRSQLNNNCRTPLNQCISTKINASYCCHPEETCNPKGTSLSTICKKHCPLESCTYPNGTINCCPEHSQCITEGKNKGICAVSTWGSSPCQSPSHVCVLDPISQLSQCCAKDEKCTPGGCAKKGLPLPKPCSAEAGTIPCKKPNGSYNCCNHGSTCIPSGPFKGQCTSNFWLGGPLNCLATPSSGYVCMSDPVSKSGTCCTSTQECTADGCMDLTFKWPAHCELDGSSVCHADGTSSIFDINGKSGGKCCCPYQECAPTGPHKGTCVDRPLKTGLVSCTSELEKCGGKCCAKDKVSGEPLQCANDKVGLCCGLAEAEVNGECCPNTQVNGRGICCKPGTVAWGETCLDKNGNPV